MKVNCPNNVNDITNDFTPKIAVFNEENFSALHNRLSQNILTDISEDSIIQEDTAVIQVRTRIQHRRTTDIRTELITHLTPL